MNSPCAEIVVNISYFREFYDNLLARLWNSWMTSRLLSDSSVKAILLSWRTLNGLKCENHRKKV